VRLVEGTAQVLEALAGHAPAVREHVATCLRAMTEGMGRMGSYGRASGAGLGLRDMREVREYCYYVAGTVGEMLTGLFSAYAPDVKAREPELAARAVAFFVGSAAVLAGGLLIMGPTLQAWLGSALDSRGVVHAAWLIAQWPLLIAALLFAFSVVLYIGPDVKHRRWRLVSPGSIVAVVVWLMVSWAFSFYTARFGTYDKTWGTLGAVVVTLVWLWLAGISLLFGGELDAETERRAQSNEGREARTPR